MDKNKKKRVLCLIKILRKKTNSFKHLKLDEIVAELNNMGISVSDRKTLYDDFNVLNECGINVEYDNGYYLLESPFNLSEIKIIIDSINSLKNLDTKLLNNLNNKLYDYVSDDEVLLLEKLKHLNKHTDSKLLQHMEDILDAINNETSILIKPKTSDEVEVFPIFLHRDNDYYYFYYHYLNSDKIYHYRFDNIKDIKLLENKDKIKITRNTIISKIEESSSSFSKGESKLILIKILKEDPRLINRFLDEFPTAIKTKEGFSIKADINNVFFSKLLNYGTDIKITNKDVSKAYTKYLKEILAIYQG